MLRVSKKGEQIIVKNCKQKLWGHVKHPEGREIRYRFFPQSNTDLKAIGKCALSKMLSEGLLYDTL